MRFEFTALILTFVFLLFPPSAAAVELGDKAPPLTGVDLDGNEISLAGLNAEGKFVFIDFWAKWCGPCMRELPHVAPFYDEFASDRFEMIGVSLDDEDTYEEMLGVVADQGLHYPIIYEGGGWQTRLAVEWDIHSIPATFLVNPDGIVVLKNVRGEEGLEIVRKLVADAPDFLPPSITMSAVLEDGMRVVGTADITSLAVGDYRMPFSIAYYQPAETEGERGEWLGGEYTLHYGHERTVEGGEAVLLTVVPSGENEAEFDVDVSQFRNANGLFLRFELEAEQEVPLGCFSLSFHSPKLDGAISLGSTYAEPPEEESAGTPGS